MKIARFVDVAYISHLGLKFDGQVAAAHHARQAGRDACLAAYSAARRIARHTARHTAVPARHTADQVATW